MTYQPVIRSQIDLEAAWNHLVQPLGFARESVWIMLIRADGTPVPQLTHIEDADVPPDRREVVRFGGFLRRLRDELDEPEGRVAVLRSRPGRDGPSPRDRQWAGAVYAACRGAGVGCETVHLATDLAIMPVPVDDARGLASA